MNWPLFLALAGLRFGINLVGLHINDFGGILQADEEDYDRPRVKAASFHLIDILTTDRRPFPGEKEMFIETKNGLRMVRIAQNWEARLKLARPFRFRDWDEVLRIVSEEICILPTSASFS